MSEFIVRVELHDAEPADYNLLHEAMEQARFLRSIRATDGIWYDLPTAEYFWRRPGGVDLVMDRAKRAADQTGRSFSLLVTEWSNGGSCHFYNLPPTQTP